jgi:hypothetical protein
MESSAERGVNWWLDCPHGTQQEIGFAIMSQFHHAPDSLFVTFATMEELRVISWNQHKRVSEAFSSTTIKNVS